MNPRDFFSEEQKLEIESAIGRAENLTSGEIRLHLAETTKGDAIKAAVNTFNKLKMYKTELRNGVLFYLSISDRKFAILGDKGINEKVPANFWDDIYTNIKIYFSQEKYVEGLTWAIEEAGRQLKSHFPLQADDENELSNEISFE